MFNLIYITELYIEKTELTLNIDCSLWNPVCRNPVLMWMPQSLDGNSIRDVRWHEPKATDSVRTEMGNR